MENNMEELILLDPLLVKLAVMFTASLLVERFLAMVSWVIDRLFTANTASDWELSKQLDEKARITEVAAIEVKYLKEAAGKKDEDSREIKPNPLRKDAQGDDRFDVKEILPPESIDHAEGRFQALREQNRVRKEFWMQILGSLIGFGGCLFLKFSIWDFVRPTDNPQLWEYLLTGMIIGAGTKPVNFLMNFMLFRKIAVSRNKLQKEESQKTGESASAEQPKEKIPLPAIAPVVATKKPKTIEDIVGFSYDGGDRPDRLEYTHFFTGPVDAIVYHHTAMNSESPFAEVVKEFDRKGWLTGYHCVILKDGTIRILCRWDRFGNHALTVNPHTMGLAFHGNFETNPQVPQANFDGQYGIQNPTDIQVDSGARITALWAIMHQIKIRFPEAGDADDSKCIIPHKHIAAKACPGNQFPYSEFQQRVRHYADLWKKDDEFQKALTVFGKIPKVKA